MSIWVKLRPEKINSWFFTENYLVLPELLFFRQFFFFILRRTSYEIRKKFHASFFLTIHLIEKWLRRLPWTMTTSLYYYYSSVSV
jgi:hypothetical protein